MMNIYQLETVICGRRVRFTGLGPKVPRVSVGSKLVLHSSFAAVELSSGQIAKVMAHWTVKVPCKNIKAVTLGGYVCTIFGSPL
jgi:hypothetical protein